MSKSLNDLRAALFDTLEGVKAGTIDLEKARAINEIGKTLVDTAKVEVDFLRATEGDSSSFIQPEQAPRLEHAAGGEWPGQVTRHRLVG
jgi:hypothetical protein